MKVRKTRPVTLKEKVTSNAADLYLDLVSTVDKEYPMLTLEQYNNVLLFLKKIALRDTPKAKELNKGIKV